MNRWRRWLCVVATILGACILVAWLVGRVVSDRTIVTQYLYWIPSFAALPLAAAAWLLAWLCARGLIADPQTGRRVFFRTRAVLLAGCAIAGAYASIFEYRLYRAVMPAQSGSLRVMSWNPGGWDPSDFALRVASRKANIVAMANVPMFTDWQKLRTSVGEPNSVVRFGRLSLISAYPVRRWGGTRLGVTGAQVRTFLWQGGGQVTIDAGEGLFAELDTTAELGRTTVIWLIDLPSDPDLWRERVCREAAATIAAYRGPAMSRGPQGLDVPQELATLGFPLPDIVVGDFNIPRGSASLRHLSVGLNDVFAGSGWGAGGHFPREVPVFALTQAFAAPWLEAKRYNAVDLGGGRHRAQVFELAPVR